MVSIDDYIVDFERYKRMAIRFPGVLDVVQCGSIKNPGVSDIDVILIIDSWYSFKPSLKLLNPERISSLFVHGPFICEESSLNDLFLFSTLRICGEDSRYYDIGDVDDVSNFTAILIRQARCFLHFTCIKLSHNDYRQVLLVGKSLMHSFDDIKRMRLLPDVLDKDHQLFLGALSSARSKMEKGEVPSEYEIINLIDGFRHLALSGMDLVGGVVEEQLLLHGVDYGERRRQGLLAWFDQEVCLGHFPKELSAETTFLSVLSQWTRFYNESMAGYMNSGALWKGGEFIFMNVNVNAVMGWKIWMRRLIKRGNKLFSLLQW